MGLGSKTVVPAKVQKGFVPVALRKAHLLHVVVKDGGRPAAEKLKGLLVTFQQQSQLHGGGKTDEQKARKGKNHEKEINVQRSA